MTSRCPICGATTLCYHDYLAMSALSAKGMTACGMCGDTGLQNGFPCPQPGCKARVHLDVDPGDCDDSKSREYALVICGWWRPEHAQSDYPGGVREEHCFICGTSVAASNLNYARAQAHSELPLKIACMGCGLQLADKSDFRGVLKEGHLPGDAKGGNA